MEGNNKNNKSLIVSKAIMPNKGVEIDISSEFKTDKVRSCEDEAQRRADMSLSLLAIVSTKF